MAPMISSEIAALARLQVESWLLPPGKSAEHALARRAHSRLLRESSCGTSDSLREQINNIATTAVRSLERMSRELDSARHSYTRTHRDSEGSFDLTGTFREIYFIDPNGALTSLLDIRQAPPIEQLSSLRKFLRDYALERAKDEVASSHMTPAYIDHLIQLHEGRRISARISVGEPEPYSLSPASLNSFEEKAARSAKGRVAALIKESKLHPHTLAQERLVALCHTVCEPLQRINVKRVPVAIALPMKALPEDCILIAECYDELADCLYLDFPSAIDGERSSTTHLTFKRFMRNSYVLRVVGSWIRAIAAPEKQARCQLCYRHKAARKRCAEHSVSTHITPAARKAAAVFPLFVETSTQLAAISDGSNIPATLPQTARTAVEDEARRCGVPEAIVPNAALLAYQLRAVVSLYGSTLSADLALCFHALLSAASEALVAQPGRTLSALHANHLARHRAEELVTLHGFLIVWFAAGKPFPISFPRLKGCGRDPAHPYLKGHFLSPRAALDEFRLASAWDEAVGRFDRETSIDPHEALSLLEKGWSYDRVAAHFGCSHDTIFRMTRTTLDGESRTRSHLKKYDARSRLLTRNTRR